MGNRMGIDCGSGGWAREGESWDNYNRTTIKTFKKVTDVAKNISYPS